MRKRLGMLLASAMMLVGVAATDAQARVDARDDGPGGKFTVVQGTTLRINIKADLLANDTFSGRPTGIRFSGVFFNKKSQGVQSARVTRNGFLVVKFRAGFTGDTRLRYVIRGIRNGRVLAERDIASIKFRVNPSPG